MITFTIQKPKEVVFEIKNVDLGADAFDRGYEAGEKDGYLNGYEIGAKEGAEVGYAKGEQEGYEKGHTAGVADGIEQGKQEEYDRFWDAYQQNGKRGNYQYAFSNFWYAENFRPKYDIRSATSGSSMNYTFSYFNNGKEPIDLARILEDCGVTLDLSPATGLISTFNYANVSRLPVLDLRNCASLNGPLNRCEAITIDKIMLTDDGSQNINDLFTWNQKCQNIVIEGCIGKSFTTKWNTAFTVASLQSFIDALKDLTGEATQTWTLSATCGGRLTDEMKATATAKNWTLAY